MDTIADHCMTFNLSSGEKTLIPEKGYARRSLRIHSASGNGVSRVHCLTINRQRGKFLSPEITWDKQ